MSTQLSLIDYWRLEQGEEVVPRCLLKVRDPLVTYGQQTPLRLIITLPRSLIDSSYLFDQLFDVLLQGLPIIHVVPMIMSLII
jgi:hypothetical protein